MMFVESVEARRLFSVVVTQALGDVNTVSGAFPAVVDLSNRFHSTTINGTVVRFATSVGGQAANIDLELFDSQTPQTVANFLKYVDGGLYDGTFFHRSVDSFIVQGGGYYFPTAKSVPKFAAVANEFTTSPKDSSGKVNTRGTVAMAKKDGDPNSADSEFFFNVADNSSNLDGQNGGFTTFAKVLGNGLTFIDTVNALPTVALASPFDELPVAADYNSQTDTLAQEDVVYVSSAKRISPITYAVASTDLGLVNPVIGTDGKLSLNFQPQATGAATITVTATDLDGATISTTFQVNIASAATPTVTYNDAVVDPTGSTPVNFGAIAVAPNTAITRSLFITNSGDQDLTNLTYGLPAGYTLGADAPTSLPSGERKELKLTLSGSVIQTLSGNFTIQAGDSTVTIPLTADLRLPVTLGNGTKSVTFVQGSGATATTATFTLTGPGTVTFEFDGDGIATAPGKSGTVVVTGSATLTNMTLASTTTASSIKMASKGASLVGIGGVTGAGTSALNAFDAKGAVLQGDFIVGSSTATTAQVKKLTLGASVNASINIGVNNDPAAALALSVGAATNTTLLVGYAISSVTAFNWDRGSGTGTIQGTNLGKLTVAGGFSGNVSLSGSLGTATIGGAIASGVWAITGSVGKLSALSGASAYQLTSQGLINSAMFKGDFSGVMNGLAVNTFSAQSGSGTTLTATQYLKTVSFKGILSGGFINSGMSIGSFSANAIDQSRIYAGVTLPQNSVLPTALTDFATGSAIGSISLKGSGTTYAFSTSAISAKVIGSAKIGLVKTLSGGDGIAADYYQSLSLLTDARAKVSVSKLDAPAKAPTLVASNGAASQFKIVVL